MNNLQKAIEEEMEEEIESNINDIEEQFSKLMDDMFAYGESKGYYYAAKETINFLGERCADEVFTERFTTILLSRMDEMKEKAFNIVDENQWPEELKEVFN